MTIFMCSFCIIVVSIFLLIKIVTGLELIEKLNFVIT